MLTPRTNEVFRFIAAEIFATGVPPTYCEIGKKLGIQSKSGVARFIEGLCDRGLITKLPKQARAITLTEAGEKLARVGRPLLATETEKKAIAELLEKYPPPWSAECLIQGGDEWALFDGKGGLIEPNDVDVMCTLPHVVNVLSRIRA